MKFFNRAALCALLLTLFSLTLSAQTGAAQAFDKDGLKFNYPADWKLADTSTPDIQNISLSKKGTNTMVAIISPTTTITTRQQYDELKAYINKHYIDAIQSGLNPQKAGDNNAQPQTSECANLNGRAITGDRITGKFNGAPAVGDIYPIVLGKRLAVLIYLRTEAENSDGLPAWREMLGSLNLAGANKITSELGFEVLPQQQGVINGQAIKLPKPSMPVIRAPIIGQVIVNVQVVLDEEGKVIEANAVGGHPVFYEKSVSAAKKSLFRPTLLCGVPTRVTGIIVYNFNPKGNILPANTHIPRPLF